LSVYPNCMPLRMQKPSFQNADWVHWLWYNLYITRSKRSTTLFLRFFEVRFVIFFTRQSMSNKKWHFSRGNSRGRYTENATDRTTRAELNECRSLKIGLSRNFKLGLQRYEVLEIMHEWLKKCLLISVWLYVFTKGVKSIQWLPGKKTESRSKKRRVWVSWSIFVFRYRSSSHCGSLLCI
jgi:hypothetical protein